MLEWWVWGPTNGQEMAWDRPLSADGPCIGGVGLPTHKEETCQPAAETASWKRESPGSFGHQNKIVLISLDSIAWDLGRNLLF